MKTKGHSAVLITILMVAATATACSSSSSGSSSPSSSAAQSTYNILEIEGLAGDLQAIGEANTVGVKAAVNWINAHGGFDGKKGVVTVENDQGDPTQSVSLLQQALSSGQKPDLLLASTSSSETVPLLDPAAQAGLLFMTSSNGSQIADASAYPYTFGTSAYGSASENAVAQYLHGKGYKSVGFLGQQADFSVTAGQAFSAAATKLGMTVHTAYLPATSIDATPELQSLLSYKPDALVLCAFGPQAGYLLSARQKLGVTIPAIGDSSFASNNLGQIAQPDQLTGLQLDLARIYVQNSPQENAANYQDFLSSVKEDKASITQAADIYVQTWNEVALAAAAATMAKSTSAAAIAAVIPKLTPATAPFVIGPLGYTATFHFPDYSPSVFTVVNAGPTSAEGSVVPGS